jgi:AcrR family transcriptional regulator
VCYNYCMSVKNERREAAIERMADHLLREGMTGASLRPLAAAAGTSDRMLLYYFVDRDELVAATLDRVAAKLLSMIDKAIPLGVCLSFPELLVAIWNAVGSADLGPYMRLWLELAAASARHQEPQRTIATGILDGFVRWTGDHLACDQADEHEQLSALLLATIDGALFLDAIGRRDLADMAIANASKLHG